MVVMKGVVVATVVEASACGSVGVADVL
jgi:hypothetical protein